MAWADITDTETEAGKPAKASVIRRLRDNLLAALLGTDPNAPRLQPAALEDIVAPGEMEHFGYQPRLGSSDFTVDDSAIPWIESKVFVRKAGTIRVVFAAAKGVNSGTCWLRVYKNGVAVGTQRNVPFWNSGSYTPVEWAEDVVVAAGDKLEIYYYQASSTGISFASFSYKTSSPFSPLTQQTYWTF